MVFSRRRICLYLLALPLVSVLLITISRFDSASLLPYSSLPPDGDQREVQNDINSESSNNDSNNHEDSDRDQLDDDPDFFWRKVPVQYPPQSISPLPTIKAAALPKVQASSLKDKKTSLDSEQNARLTDRREAVKKTFVRCWQSYEKHAWLSDELAPISGGSKNTFGGWAATLVDSLDTLWIMDLREDFELAVAAATNISFETVSLDEVNVFETNIRYLGGFLSAYDLSGDRRLLRKAKEVGDMLYAAFDTPNRMPITRWKMREVVELVESGESVNQVAHDNVLLAELGSFSMEFTRLSIVTGDPRWYDAAKRITDLLEKQQDSTALPGMWPIVVNARDQLVNQHTGFTLGAMADSAFEYLPKTFALLGGRVPVYRTMYEKAVSTAMKHNFYRPMAPHDGKEMLISGLVNVHTGDRSPELDPEGQHLVCFAGGMLAIGSRLFELPDHLEKAHKLVDGCIWTYQALPLGIMPESFHMIPCPSPGGQASLSSCPWNETLWKQEILRKQGLYRDDMRREDVVEKADSVITQKRLPKGFSNIGDTRYILRPEAIESVFVLYRTTGREDLLEAAWKMFEAIEKNTKTELPANAALSDITVDADPPKSDSMESFWMGETLKYFYLIFSDDPDLISLDEWVFNTEAHPFRIWRS